MPANDLFNFYRMLADHGVTRGKRILSAQAVGAMLHDYNPDHRDYALTMSVQDGVHPLLKPTSLRSFGQGVFLPQMVGGDANLAQRAFTQISESAVR